MLASILKVLHLFFLILWLGGLFALTLFWSSCQTLARSWYRRFDLPCMALALACGISLLCIQGVHMKAGWFHMKMTGAIGLVGYDFWLGRRTSETRPLVSIVIYVALLLMTLAAVYAVRDKEAEWRKKWDIGAVQK